MGIIRNICSMHGYVFSYMVHNCEDCKERSKMRIHVMVVVVVGVVLDKKAHQTFGHHVALSGKLSLRKNKKIAV